MSSRWPLVIAGLGVGLVIGGAVVGIPWALTSGGPTGTDADVAAACDAIARTDNLDPVTHLADFRRWGAAAELAAAAAEADPSLKPLSEAVRKPIDVVNASFRAEGPAFTAAVTTARQACADASNKQ